MEKKCNKCGIPQILTEFSNCNTCKDGLQLSCKTCYKKYYNINKNKIKKDLANYRKENKEYFVKYRKENKKSLKENSKNFYKENKTEISLKKKEKYIKNSKLIKEKSAEYYKNNKNKIKISKQKYRKNNRIKLNSYNNTYMKKRRQEDYNYRLKTNVRSMISRLLKNKKDGLSTTKILGCSYNDFKQYLESKFQPWMNWNNYGKYNGEFDYGWDIDHIIPVSSAITKEEIIKLNHYHNLQPLCGKINRTIKKDTI